MDHRPPPRFFSSAEPAGQGPTIFSPFTEPGNRDFNQVLAICGRLAKSPFARVAFQAAHPELCAPGAEGLLLADVIGRGELGRIWMTSSQPYDKESLSIWIDGKAAIQRPLKGQTLHLSRDPIHFEKRAQVYLVSADVRRLYYHQITATTDESPPARCEFNPLMPTEELTGEGELPLIQGPGRILSLTIDAQGPALLEIFWEGSPTPAISLPVGALFGELVPNSCAVDSLLIRGHELLAPMPFRKEARIRVVTEDHSLAKITARFARGAVGVDEGYLHASYRDFTPVARSTQPERFTLPARGSGKWVATILSLEGRTARNGWVRTPWAFLEGDEEFHRDGQVISRGTGTEDYFDSAWYFADHATPGPESGVMAIGVKSDHAWVAAYRYHLGSEALSFEREMVFSLELGAGHPESVRRYRGVGLYYLGDP